MSDPLKQLRSRVAKAPTGPGVYRWMDESGTVLYVGKAKDLRSRLRSYVTPKPDKGIGPWKLSLREKIRDVDWTIARTELEALVLETNLIKENRPKYNVLMKDDKNYVYVKVTVKDPYPTVEIVRQLEKDGAQYFGPYLRAMDTRRTLDMVHELVGFRACKESLSVLNRGGDRAIRLGAAEPRRKLRPCLDYQIGQCIGLCAGVIPPEEYLARIEKLISFLKGDYEPLIERAKEGMKQAAATKQFEKASHFRDSLESLELMAERQIVSDTSGEDVDVFGVALLSGAVHAVVLRKRRGKLIDEQSFSLMGRSESIEASLEQLLPQYYEASPDVPDDILVAEDFAGRGALEAFLSEKRGKKVHVKMPSRGTKSKLLTLAEQNAKEKALQAEASWEADSRNAEEALKALQELLHLNAPPKRIEGYDISHLGGTETVGSMVVVIGGKPRNDQYRSFTIRTLKSGDVDDYRALKEVLTRRLRHLMGGIKAEEQKWEGEGVTIRKSKHADAPTIEGLLGSHPEGQALLAEHNGNIVGIALLSPREDLTELSRLWIEEVFQHGPLGSFLVRKVVGSAKEKVYTLIDAELETSYGAVGFRHVQRSPKAFPQTLPEGKVLLVADPKDLQLDQSLSERPDLLVIDGGKGQLGAVVDVLRSWKIDIPVIGLAKREEEIFVPNQSDPLIVHKDSPGKFLLMRLRDEAHRFANRHREKRLWNALVKD